MEYLESLPTLSSSARQSTARPEQPTYEQHVKALAEHGSVLKFVGALQASLSTMGMTPRPDAAAGGGGRDGSAFKGKEGRGAGKQQHDEGLTALSAAHIVATVLSFQVSSETPLFRCDDEGAAPVCMWEAAHDVATALSCKLPAESSMSNSGGGEQLAARSQPGSQ